MTNPCPKIAIVVNSQKNILRFRMSLISYLDQLGMTVVVYSDRSEVILSKTRCYPVFSASSFFLYGLLISYINLIKSFFRDKPDIVLSFTLKANFFVALATYFFSFKFVPNISGLGSLFLKNKTSRTIALILLRKIKSRADWIVFQNRSDKQLIYRVFKLRDKRFSLVPGSGIDTKIYRPETERSRPGSDEISFLMIARATVDKGIFEYLEAAKCINFSGSAVGRKIKFTLITEEALGNPNKISVIEISKRAQEAGVNVLVDCINPLVELRAADVFILPSYREGLSRFLLEGLALGKVLLASNVPGCREAVIQGSNGFLFPSRDSDGVCVAIEKVLSMSLAERAQFGNFSRKLAEKKFDVSTVSGTYYRVIREFSNVV